MLYFLKQNFNTCMKSFLIHMSFLWHILHVYIWLFNSYTCTSKLNEHKHSLWPQRNLCIALKNFGIWSRLFLFKLLFCHLQKYICTFPPEIRRRIELAKHSRPLMSKGFQYYLMCHLLSNIDQSHYFPSFLLLKIITF